jgi:drug/metabolite transporter (DMT)-like permease
VFARVLLPAERLSPLGVVALLVGLVGAVVLATVDPTNLTADGTVARFSVLLAPTAFALGSVITRALDTDMAIETMEAWAMLLGAGLMHLAAAAIGESPATIAWTTEAVLALGYLAVVASGAGYLLYFRLLDQLGPIEINLVSYAAPVFAALSGWLVLGEGLEPNTVAGFVLVCAGFAIVKRTAIRTELHRAGLLA